MLCKNCGFNDSGEFCSQCGQKIKIHLNPTLHDVIHDTVHEFLHLDGKIFQTLLTLFRYPGKLTQEYLAGRRVSYVTPIRLYLTLSLVYFLIPSFSTKTEVHSGADKVKKESSKGSSDEDLVMNIQTGTFMDPKLKEWGIAFKRGVKKISKDSKEFKKLYFSVLAKSLFLLMPLFAFILKLTYWRRKQRYPQYLYFAIHYHAALFAGLILCTFIDYIYDEIMLWWVLWAWLYLVLSFKRIWGDSTKRAIQRTILTLFPYGVIFSVTMAFSAVYAIYKLGVEAA
ncbi:MAG: DUF3667 domain-containing protein [Bdellovibrionaceae bacterium]|nr:DUF3667 domain-containing protein [Pseudobdellovibrionaceae bacterium]